MTSLPGCRQFFRDNTSLDSDAGFFCWWAWCRRWCSGRSLIGLVRRWSPCRQPAAEEDRRLPKRNLRQAVGQSPRHLRPPASPLRASRRARAWDLGLAPPVTSGPKDRPHQPLSPWPEKPFLHIFEEGGQPQNHIFCGKDRQTFSEKGVDQQQTNYCKHFFQIV